MTTYSDQEICDRILEAFEGSVTKGECSPRVDIPLLGFLRSDLEMLKEGVDLSALDSIMDAVESWSQDIFAKCDGADPEIERGTYDAILNLIPKIRRMCAGEEFVP